MKEINADVFRKYDIRGIVDQDFDLEWVESLGKATGTYFRNHGHNRALIGHDCRHSSPAYQSALAAGIASTGIDVICIDQVPTPVQYFAVKHLGLHAGVMITASHNPSNYNGFKVWSGESTIYADEIQALYQIMKAGDFAQGNGVISYHDMVPAYVEALTDGLKLDRPLKIIVDGGNGAGGEICAEVLRRIGAEVIELYCVPDGDFPNHHPDPVVPENMTQLCKMVVDEGANLGIGLDGDGDRIGAVDEKGTLLFGDQLLAVYSRDMLSRRPGETVIGDVKCSHLLFSDIEKHGGRSIMAVTGHSVIKARMQEENAALAGELSGHMFFADEYYGFDDAIYSALRLARLAAQTDTPLSKMLNDWPRTYTTPEIHITCEEKFKSRVIEQAIAFFSKSHETITIDGARVSFGDGWGLVRASNTQPVLVLRFEAESAERLEEIRDTMVQAVEGWVASAS